MDELNNLGLNPQPVTAPLERDIRLQPARPLPLDIKEDFNRYEPLDWQFSFSTKAKYGSLEMLHYSLPYNFGDARHTGLGYSGQFWKLFGLSSNDSGRSATLDEKIAAGLPEKHHEEDMTVVQLAHWKLSRERSQMIQRTAMAAREHSSFLSNLIPYWGTSFVVGAATSPAFLLSLATSGPVGGLGHIMARQLVSKGLPRFAAGAIAGGTVFSAYDIPEIYQMQQFADDRGMEFNPYFAYGAALLFPALIGGFTLGKMGRINPNNLNPENFGKQLPPGKGQRVKPVSRELVPINAEVAPYTGMPPIKDVNQKIPLGPDMPTGIPRQTTPLQPQKIEVGTPTAPPAVAQLESAFDEWHRFSVSPEFRIGVNFKDTYIAFRRMGVSKEFLQTTLNKSDRLAKMFVTLSHVVDAATMVRVSNALQKLVKNKTLMKAFVRTAAKNSKSLDILIKRKVLTGLDKGFDTTLFNFFEVEDVINLLARSKEGLLPSQAVKFKEAWDVSFNSPTHRDVFDLLDAEKLIHPNSATKNADLEFIRGSSFIRGFIQIIAKSRMLEGLTITPTSTIRMIRNLLNNSDLMAEFVLTRDLLAQRIQKHITDNPQLYKGDALDIKVFDNFNLGDMFALLAYANKKGAIRIPGKPKVKAPSKNDIAVLSKQAQDFVDAVQNPPQHTVATVRKEFEGNVKKFQLRLSDIRGSAIDKLDLYRPFTASELKVITNEILKELGNLGYKLPIDVYFANYGSSQIAFMKMQPSTKGWQYTLHFNTELLKFREQTALGWIDTIIHEIAHGTHRTDKVKMGAKLRAGTDHGKEWQDTMKKLAAHFGLEGEALAKGRRNERGFLSSPLKIISARKAPKNKTLQELSDLKEKDPVAFRDTINEEAFNLVRGLVERGKNLKEATKIAQRLQRLSIMRACLKGGG